MPLVLGTGRLPGTIVRGRMVSGRTRPTVQRVVVFRSALWLRENFVSLLKLAKESRSPTAVRMVRLAQMPVSSTDFLSGGAWRDAEEVIQGVLGHRVHFAMTARWGSVRAGIQGIEEGGSNDPATAFLPSQHPPRSANTGWAAANRNMSRPPA
jgi:hypothetical protein